jgi:hypothetical protein
MLIDRYCEVYGLQKCEFKDECDSCETPDIQSYVSIGNGETNYYICHNCVIEKIKGNIDFAVDDGYVSEMEKQELKSQLKTAEAEVTKLRGLLDGYKNMVKLLVALDGIQTFTTEVREKLMALDEEGK